MKKALEKAMGDLKFEMKGLDSARGEELRKALEGARKSQNGAYDSLSPKEAEEFRKAMERIRGQNSVETRKAVENERGNIILRRKALEDARAKVTLNGQDIDGLLKSITPVQREIAKKQGYLKVSDLTPEQRKLAGIRDGGTIEITINRDGDVLKIKSE